MTLRKWIYALYGVGVVAAFGLVVVRGRVAPWLVDAVALLPLLLLFGLAGGAVVVFWLTAPGPPPGRPRPPGGSGPGPGSR